MGAQFISLAEPANYSLRHHVLFGDDLGMAGEGGSAIWYRRQKMLALSESTEWRLSFEYLAQERGQVFTLKFGALELLLIDKLVRIGESVSLTAIERRWLPTIGRVGALVLLREQPSNEQLRIALNHPLFVFARRSRHPSHILDRFATRDRALAAREMAALLEEESLRPRVVRDCDADAHPDFAVRHQQGVGPEVLKSLSWFTS